MNKLKYALVTGSTSGIGKQIALDFLKAGCFVIVNYHSSQKDAELVKKELLKISSNFAIVKSDLSDRNACSEFYKTVIKITKKLDYIVFNAGYTVRKDFFQLKIKDWDKVMDTNLTIPFFLIQKFSKHISYGGKIVFIGSILGIYPHSVSIVYGVSKSSLHILTKYLIKIFSPRKITVNVIVPGFVDTAWHKDKNKQLKKKICNRIALKRFAVVDEISKACLSIINNDYINGQSIVVDGGYNYY